MRISLSIVCALAFAAPAWAQLPPEGPQRDQLRNQVMQDWETALGKVASLKAQCVRTTEDKVFGTKETYRGEIKYAKADPAAGTPRRAAFKLTSDANPADYEQLVLLGRTLYNVSPTNKEIRVFNLPDGQGNQIDLLFGMTAAQAVARYKVDLLPLKGNDEKLYWMLRMEPKAAADKANFASAGVALLKTTNLPRTIYLQQVNGNRVTWDLPVLDPAARLGAADFAVPPLPPGWKLERAPER